MDIRDFRGHDLEPGDRVVFCQNNKLMAGTINSITQVKDMSYNNSPRTYVKICISVPTGIKRVTDMKKLCKVPL